MQKDNIYNKTRTGGKTMTKKKEPKSGFRIICDCCKRQLCDFQFTEEGDIVIYCRSCGQARMIFKDKNKSTVARNFI